MKAMMLQLDRHLQVTSMSNHQQEIIEFIENHATWLEFVDRVNKVGIPANIDGEHPTDEWYKENSFPFYDLVAEAYVIKEWKGPPETGAFILNFYSNYTDIRENTPNDNSEGKCLFGMAFSYTLALILVFIFVYMRPNPAIEAAALTDSIRMDFLELDEFMLIFSVSCVIFFSITSLGKALFCNKKLKG